METAGHFLLKAKLREMVFQSFHKRKHKYKMSKGRALAFSDPLIENCILQRIVLSQLRSKST